MSSLSGTQTHRHTDTRTQTQAQAWPLLCFDSPIQGLHHAVVSIAPVVAAWVKAGTALELKWSLLTDNVRLLRPVPRQ